MKKRIVLLGGDLRQYYMAKSLIRKDFAISYYGLNFPQEEQGAHQCRDKGALWSALREADALVLPDPVSRDGITVGCMISCKMKDYRLKMQLLLQRLRCWKQSC